MIEFDSSDKSQLKAGPNRGFSEMNEIAADMFYGCHLIYPGEFGVIWDSVVWSKLHNIILGRVWALVRANMSFKL